MSGNNMGYPDSKRILTQVVDSDIFLGKERIYKYL